MTALPKMDPNQNHQSLLSFFAKVLKGLDSAVSGPISWSDRPVLLRCRRTGVVAGQGTWEATQRPYLSVKRREKRVL
jgi:hypothetical protein